MIETFRRAHEHQGAAFVEMYQNCNVFNDGAFEAITDKDARADMLIELKHGEPIRFGADGERGVVLNEFGEAEIVRRRRRRRGRAPRARRAPRRPVARVRAVAPGRPRRRCRRRSACSATIDRPTYEAEVQRQLVDASERSGPRRPRGAASAPAPPGTVELARARPAQSKLRNTIPVRGFGAKNVVFCGMRTPAAAAARIVCDA